jgi:bifunctional non-homologous end joining protein LigD
LPRSVQDPRAGPGRTHVIKYDGFRILARKDGDRIRLITRNGYYFADRYPVIVDAMARLPVETCIIDREAVVVDQVSFSSCSLELFIGAATRLGSAARCSAQELRRNLGDDD